jgi:hypothetical protein
MLFERCQYHISILAKFTVGIVSLHPSSKNAMARSRLINIFTPAAVRGTGGSFSRLDAAAAAGQAKVRSCNTTNGQENIKRRLFRIDHDWLLRHAVWASLVF